MDADGDGIPDAYESTNGMNFLSAADALLDKDGDGFSNRDEYTAGTGPNDPASRFTLLSNQFVAPASYQLSLAGAAGRKYKLLRSTTLAGAWQMIEESPTLGIAQVVTLTDPAAPAGQAFYKVEVSIP
jgi:hypothetical protein